MNDDPVLRQLELIAARTGRIATDVASLVKRADTSDLRLHVLEDQGANQSRAFVSLQAQVSDIADSLRRIERRLDVQVAVDGDR